MEMHQVRYFLAAAEIRNFTKAAAACGVSAPSLLRAIRLLELEFGGPLFNRERGNMHLTELGKLAFPHLQQVLREAEEAKRKAKTLLDLGRSTLKIGIMCTVAPSHFVPLIDGFHRRYPKILLHVLDQNAQKLQAGLLSGELEVAIYALPGVPPHERLHALPLFKEQMFIAVHSKHPLGKKKQIESMALNGEPYLDRLNCEFTGYADRLFIERSISGETVYGSERDDWVLAMVASGLGYGFMPESTVRFPGVVGRPLVQPELWRIVNLVTMRGRPHSPAVGAFVREVMRMKWMGGEALAKRDAAESRDDEDVDGPS